jgi:hypothetical protein
MSVTGPIRLVTVHTTCYTHVAHIGLLPSSRKDLLPLCRFENVPCRVSREE